MDLTPDIGTDEEAYLEMESRASEPYTSFVFSSADQARRLRRFLFARGLCEFSPPYGLLLRDTRRPVGLLAVLSGNELTRFRLRAALALRKSGLLEQDPAMANRLHIAGQALLKLMPEDFYVSRLAASELERGRGIGTYLLRQAEIEARARSCPRIALEVAPTSVTALRLYLQQGYREIEAKEVTDVATGRQLSYLHLAKTLR